MREGRGFQLRRLGLLNGRKHIRSYKSASAVQLGWREAECQVELGVSRAVRKLRKDDSWARTGRTHRPETDPVPTHLPPHLVSPYLPGNADTVRVTGEPVSQPLLPPAPCSAGLAVGGDSASTSPPEVSGAYVGEVPSTGSLGVACLRVGKVGHRWPPLGRCTGGHRGPGWLRGHLYSRAIGGD